MTSLSRIKLELKKLSLQKILIIVCASCIIPFLFTLFIIYTQPEGISQLSTDLLINNLVGPWYSLLLGMLVIVLSYIVTEEEQRKNIIRLYQAYKKNWYTWILNKSIIVMLILFCVFFVNTLLSAIIIKILENMISSQESFSELFTLYLQKFSKAYVFVLPGLFFQLLLTVLIRNPVLPVVLGLLLMILGIPIANLSNTYLIPYSYPILSQNPATNMINLAVSGIAIMVLSSFLINKLLSKHRI